MKKEYCWCLYTDKKQTKLLSMAYSEEEIKTETSYYTKGVWFKYDVVNGKHLINESIVRGIKFPKIATERPFVISEVKEKSNWIK